jgi:replication factor C large subunit
MWQLKHSPASLDLFLGKSAVEEARKWDGAAMIISGGSGTGKTILAHLLAAERGWELVEVSDGNLDRAQDIANTGSLFGGRKALLIEDVDAVKDIKGVASLLDAAKAPVLMTTSDYESKRLATVRRKSAKLQLRRPLPASIVKYLEAVCRAEGVLVDKAVLERIAKGCAGDMRAALNDLETLAKGRGSVTEAQAEGLLPERDRGTDIYKALSIIFGGRELKKVVESTWDLSEQPKDVIWWVEENLPRLYPDRESIREAFGNLARADVFLGRILRRQYWGFLRYANVLMTAGVNVSRPQKINFTQYMFPGYFMALGRSKGGRSQEESIASKMGPKLHASARLIRREYIPLYRTLLSRGKADADGLRELFNLSEEDLEYMSPSS